MKKILFPLVVAVLVVSGCGRFSNKEKDKKGDMRIVCLSKHLTEMMFAIGKGKDLVAVDLSSTYPDSAKLLKTVGYHRALSAEGIISLNPDLVIHSNDIGPENVNPQLIKAGLKVKIFGGANTIDSARLLLRELGSYFGVQKVADSVVSMMDANIAAALDKVKQRNIVDSPTVMIIHFGRASNIYFVMTGRNGVGDKMIRLAGGKTATYDAKGARQISAEAVAASNPDIIIATDYGYDQMGSMEKFITGVPGVSLTNAAKNKKIYRFEEHDLIYFGPRTGENILKMLDIIHPQVNATQK
jgi:iron complex transport system substrate-binding protein